MKKYLFIVLGSPFKNEVVGMINTLAGDSEKAVLLFEDGVYHAAHSEKRKELADNGIKIYAIKDDLAARGYADIKAEDVNTVDHSGAVDLIMEEYDSAITI